VKDSLYFNKFGAPSRPNRSMDNFLLFLESGEAIEHAIDWISYESCTDINDDQQKGLDGWMSEEDSKMLDYYREAKSRSSH